MLHIKGETWEKRAGREVTENERIREGSGNKDKMLGKRDIEGKNKNAIRMTEKWRGRGVAGAYAG